MIAASLWFDPALEAEIRELWAGLARAGITDGLHAGPYRPHVTLGSWDSMALAPFMADLQRLADQTSPLRMHFDAVGTFEDRESVAFLRPRPSAALASIRARVHAIAAAHGSGVHHRTVPDTWNPHCTLAWGLAPATLARALEFLHGAQLPAPGRAVAIGVIDTPAEIELERIELRA